MSISDAALTRFCMAYYILHATDGCPSVSCGVHKATSQCLRHHKCLSDLLRVCCWRIGLRVVLWHQSSVRLTSCTQQMDVRRPQGCALAPEFYSAHLLHPTDGCPSVSCGVHKATSQCLRHHKCLSDLLRVYCWRIGLRVVLWHQSSTRLTSCTQQMDVRRSAVACTRRHHNVFVTTSVYLICFASTAGE
ncbi:hypothetical protein J6590_034629 [Homalodisca vitripennis]|nr:hypothetical protein J6590_034629 [Homalodisca vitripennis]